jgi:hypothetical protein
VSLLDDIKLNEEQKAAVIEEMDKWKEAETKRISEEITSGTKEKLEEVKEKVNKLGNPSRIVENEDGSKDLDFNEEEKVILEEKLSKWKENIFEEAEESLGEKFGKVYKDGESKMKKDYSERFTNTLKEMAIEIEKNSKEQLLETAEFKTFNEFKKLIAPYIVEGEYSDTMVEDNNKLKAIIKEQAQVIEDTKIKKKLDQLTDGMPVELKEKFISNLGKVNTEDELIESFQKNLDLVKLVKDQVVTELDASHDTKSDETVSSPEVNPEEKVISEDAKPEDNVEAKKEEAPVKEAASKKAEPKSEKESIKEKILAEEASVKEKVSDEEFSTESNLDYEVLSEDFKREEEKSDGLSRMLELAGVER